MKHEPDILLANPRYLQCFDAMLIVEASEPTDTSTHEANMEDDDMEFAVANKSVTFYFCCCKVVLDCYCLVSILKAVFGRSWLIWHL